MIVLSARRLRRPNTYLTGALAAALIFGCGERQPGAGERQPGAGERQPGATYIVDLSDGAPPVAEAPATPRFRPGELNAGPRSEAQPAGPEVCHDDLRIGGQCMPVAQACGDGRPGTLGARARLASLEAGCIDIGPRWTPPCVDADAPQGVDCVHVVTGPPLEPEVTPGADCAEPWRTAEGCRPRWLADPGQICPPGEHVAAPRTGCASLDDVARSDGSGGCGEGPWGDIASRPGDVYVDASAVGGGDGSRARPLSSLGDALEVVGPAGRVVLAAGDYPIRATVLAESVAIRGRCASRVAIVADPGSAPTLRMQGVGDHRPMLTLSDLTLRAPPDDEATGAEQALRIVNAVADVRRVHVHGFGHALRAMSGDVTLEHVSITGARATGRDGTAVLLGDDSVFSMRSSEVFGGAVDTAVYVGRCSRATLEDVHIAGVLSHDGVARSLMIAREGEDEHPEDGRPPRSTCGDGRPAGGRLALTDVVVVADQPGAGLRAQAGARVVLSRVEVHGPGPLGPDELFLGLEGVGAQIDARQVIVRDATGTAMVLRGARLALTDSLIERVGPVTRQGPGGADGEQFASSASGFGILSLDRDPVTASAGRQRISRTIIRDVHHVGLGVYGRSLDARSIVIGDVHLSDAERGEAGGGTPASAIMAIGRDVLVTDSVLLGSPGSAIQAVGRTVSVTDTLIADGGHRTIGALDPSPALILSADRLVLARTRVTGNDGGGVILSGLASAADWFQRWGLPAAWFAILGPPLIDEAPTAAVTHNRIDLNRCADGVHGVTLTIDSALSARLVENTLRDNCAVSAIQVFPLHDFDPAAGCPAPATQTAAFQRNLVVGHFAPPRASTGGVGVGCHLGARCTFEGDMLLDNQTVGLQAWGRGTRVEARHVLVENTGHAERNYMGMGLLVEAGAVGEVRHSRFMGNRGAGVAAMGRAWLEISHSQIALTGTGFYALELDPTPYEREPIEACGALPGGPGDPMLAEGGRCLADDVPDDLSGPYVAALAADGILAVGSRVEMDDVELAFNARAGVMFDCAAGSVRRARVVGSRFCLAADDNVTGIDHDFSTLLCEDNVFDDVVDNVPGDFIGASLDAGPPPPDAPFRGDD